VPGHSVGGVTIGDPRDTVLKQFPFKKEMDSEYKWTELRTEIRWLDVKSKRVLGDITFSIRDGRVFQIEAATPSFKTGGGITLSSTPEEVKRQYAELKAFALLNSGGNQVGGRDLIYWVSESQGIAFELSYFPNAKRRLVHKVIVFQPGTEFLPKGQVQPPQLWKELTPFSLDAGG